MEEVTNETQISEARESLTDLITMCRNIASDRPEYGAEIVLAQRHLEDARMRLGVALSISRGDDPFAFKQPGE